MLGMERVALADADAPPPTMAYDPHVRFGVSALGCVFVRTAGSGKHDPASDFGGAGGIELQAGVQITRLVAVFYDGKHMAGGFAPNETSPFGFAGFSFNELMVDFTLPADPRTGVVLQLGVAPSVDVFCAAGTCDAFPGADARLAFVLGNHAVRRRTGLAFGIEFHPSFVTDATFTTSALISSVLLTIGFELY